MKKPTIIAIVVGIIIILAVIVGIGSIMSKPNSPTSTTQVTHTQQGQIQLQTNLLMVNAISVNLDNLTPGAGGVSNTFTKMIINKGGYYLFYLTNLQELEKEFYYFRVIFVLLSQTEYVTGNMGWPTPNGPLNYTVYLKPGTYELNISLVYGVFSNASPTTFSGTFLAFGNSSVMYEAANVSFTIQTTSSGSTQTSASLVHMRTQPLNNAMVLTSEERNLYILPKLI